MVEQGRDGTGALERGPVAAGWATETRLHLPPPIRLGYWTLKRLAILVGFLLTMLGGVGAYLYVQPAEHRSSSVDETIKALAVKIELIKNATAQYYMFEQQGSLIFAISAANTNPEARDDIGRLRQLALLNRTFAVRQIIGQLAIAGQLNYRETSDGYQKLIDAARKDFTLPNFLAVKDFEAKYMTGAETQSGQLQMQRDALMQEMASDDRIVDDRKLVLLVLTSLGSAFLLAANLIATKDDGATRESEAGTGPSRTAATR